MTPSRAALELARAIAESQDCRPFDVEQAARLIDEKVGPLRDLAWRYVDLCDKDTDSDLDPWRPGGDGKP